MGGDSGNAVHSGDREAAEQRRGDIVRVSLHGGGNGQQLAAGELQTVDGVCRHHAAYDQRGGGAHSS